jgi:hypothetical protein
MIPEGINMPINRKLRKLSEKEKIAKLSETDHIKIYQQMQQTKGLAIFEELSSADREAYSKYKAKKIEYILLNKRIQHTLTEVINPCANKAFEKLFSQERRLTRRSYMRESGMHKGPHLFKRPSCRKPTEFPHNYSQQLYQASLST